MKKGLLSLAVIFAFFFAFNSVDAASVSVSAPKTAVVGNTFTVNVTVSSDVAAWDFSIGYDNSKLRVMSSNLENSLRSASLSAIHSRSYSLTFKALSSGTAKIYVSDASLYNDSETLLSASKGSTSVTIKTQAEIEASYSKNNNLASLSVEGATLSPTFNQDTTEYTVELEPETTSINVSASAADAKATVSGIGQREVTEGDNNIEVKVTAENGSVKTYTIKATVKEYDPIKVKINGKEYTVVRKKSMLPELNGYTDTTVTINDTEVPALKSDVTGYTLVALKDSKGNQNYYVKDKDNYTLYKEYTIGGTTLQVLDKKVKKGLKKASFKYDGDDIVGYQEVKMNLLKNTYALDNNDITGNQFYLFYAKNVETGKENLYQYDALEKTVQRYNLEVLDMYKKNSSTYYMYLVGGILLIILLVLLFISSLISNHKLKDRLLIKDMYIDEDEVIKPRHKKK